MGHSKTVKNPAPGKKEKVFHPQSRKASQIGRSNNRKDKMAEAATKRGRRQALQADIYSFFYHALPPEGVLALSQMHDLIRDVWLTRHDSELESERTARRQGRPKSTKQMKLEEIRLREEEDYRTGLELVDLTHAANVALFRAWDLSEVAYVQMLRFIRISSSNPDVATVSRPGKHIKLVPPKAKGTISAGDAMDAAMDDDEAPELIPAAGMDVAS